MARRAERERLAVTEARLSEVALAYLNRVGASKRALERKLFTWVRERGDPPDVEAARPLVQALIERYERSRILDDDRLAANVAGALRRRGASSRAISHRLQTRGLSHDSIEHALQSEREEDGNAELTAARALVRRRKLGPFRPEAERAEKRRNDLAALGRAGFDFETARRALECDAEELE